MNNIIYMCECCALMMFALKNFLPLLIAALISTCTIDRDIIIPPCLEEEVYLYGNLAFGGRGTGICYRNGNRGNRSHYEFDGTLGFPGHPRSKGAIAALVAHRNEIRRISKPSLEKYTKKTHFTFQRFGLL